jgi:hypothetical protein
LFAFLPARLGMLVVLVVLVVLLAALAPALL